MKIINPSRLQIAQARDLKKSCLIPWASCADMADMNKLLETKKGCGYMADSMLLYFLKESVKDTPEANSRWIDFNEAPSYAHLEFYEHIDLGLTLAGKKGLVVATIPSAEEKSITELNEMAVALSAKAEAGRFSQSDFIPQPVIALNNVGAFKNATDGKSIPVPHHTVMVSVFRAKFIPVVSDEGKIEPRLMAKVYVIFDHRALDGAVAHKLLSSFKEKIENPRF